MDIAGILLNTVGIIFAFGTVIFVHEFGHFIVAKKSGVKVERFSFGLGPETVGSFSSWVGIFSSSSKNSPAIRTSPPSGSQAMQ
jgi:hypothetical protein